MAVYRQQSLQHFSNLLAECMEDRIFDWKRHFFRQLLSFKTDRGEKIKEISNRRRQRSIKLVPFLVCSCQRSLATGHSKNKLAAFNLIKAAASRTDVVAPQTGYQIKMSASGLNPASMGEVSTNLQRKFEDSRTEVSRLSQKSPTPRGKSQPKDNKDKSSSNTMTKTFKESTKVEPKLVAKTPRVTPTRKRMASPSPSPTPGVSKVKATAGTSPFPSKKTIDELIAEKKQQIFQLKMRERGRGYYKHMEEEVWNDQHRTEKPHHQQSFCPSVSHHQTSVASTEAEFRDKHGCQKAHDGKVVPKDTQKGLKALTLFVNIKIKSYNRKFIDSLKKQSTDKIRKLIPNYKRRNFMQLEKTLTVVKSNLLRQAFALVKIKKHIVVPKEFTTVKLGLLAGMLCKLYEQANLKRALVAIQLVQRKSSQGMPCFNTSRDDSEIKFRDIQVAYFESEQFSHKFMRAIQIASEDIKGHKKTKRCFIVSMMLHLLFSNRKQAYRRFLFETLKQHKLLTDKYFKGFRILKEVIESSSIRTKICCLELVHSRALQIKAKNVSYLADVLKTVLKKRALQPTFHYLKFEIPRILKNNSKILMGLANRILTVFTKRAHSDYKEFMGRLKTLKKQVNRAKKYSGTEESKKLAITNSSLNEQALLKNLSQVNEHQKTRLKPNDVKGGALPMDHSNPALKTNALKKKAREVSPQVIISKVPSETKSTHKTKNDEECSKNKTNKPSKASSKQGQSTIQGVTLEKDSNRMNRLINAITQNPRHVPEVRKGKPHSKFEVQIDPVLLYEGTAEFRTLPLLGIVPEDRTSVVPPLNTRPKSNFGLKSGRQNQKEQPFSNARQASLEKVAELDHHHSSSFNHGTDLLGAKHFPLIHRTLTDDEDEEERVQILEIEKQGTIQPLDQLTVHDLKSTLNDKNFYQEMVATVQAFMTSKYNSEGIAAPCQLDYFSFQKYDQVFKDLPATIGDFKPDSQRSNQRTEKSSLVNKENIPLAINSIPKFFEGTSISPKAGAHKPQLFSNSHQTSESSVFRNRSEQALGHSSSGGAGLRASRYQQESSDQDEDSECDVLNYLTIVRAPEEKAPI